MALFRRTALVLICHVVFLYACNSNNDQSINNSNNVILVTLDGVRWQEVFRGSDSKVNTEINEPVIFKNMSRELMDSGILLGNRDIGSEMTVSNPDIISLPAYESIMTGAVQDCHTNSCPRVPVETLQERVRREFNLNKYEVATFASWKQITLAAEHTEGSTLVNAGNSPVSDGSEDQNITEMNLRQLNDLPRWGESRKDQHTFSQALYYLKKHQPKFLYISLNDSDEWSHHGNYPEYIKTLKQYDEWIATLIQTLKEMGEYGRSTTLIVTTDHGRGDENTWTDHGAALSEAKYIWLYATRINTRPPTPLKKVYTHIDIRPTIEAILNLKPTHCESCGTVMPELVTISDRTLD